MICQQIFSIHSKLSRREAVTRRSFHTQKLLHRDAFSKLLHKESITQRKLYTEMLLHTKTFTQRSFYTQAFSHNGARNCSSKPDLGAKEEKTILKHSTFSMDFLKGKSPAPV